MQFVEIFKLKDDGSQEILATCRLIKDQVSCEGNEVFIKNIEQEGIVDYSQSSNQKIFFKDGIKFLEQLQYNFKSGYLNASKVKNGN